MEAKGSGAWAGAGVCTIEGPRFRVVASPVEASLVSFLGYDTGGAPRPRVGARRESVSVAGSRLEVGSLFTRPASSVLANAVLDKCLPSEAMPLLNLRGSSFPSPITLTRYQLLHSWTALYHALARALSLVEKK